MWRRLLHFLSIAWHERGGGRGDSGRCARQQTPGAATRAGASDHGRSLPAPPSRPRAPEGRAAGHDGWVGTQRDRVQPCGRSGGGWLRPLPPHREGRLPHGELRRRRLHARRCERSGGVPRCETAGLVAAAVDRALATARACLLLPQPAPLRPRGRERRRVGRGPLGHRGRLLRVRSGPPGAVWQEGALALLPRVDGGQDDAHRTRGRAGVRAALGLETGRAERVFGGERSAAHACRSLGGPLPHHPARATLRRRCGRCGVVGFNRDRDGIAHYSAGRR